MRHGKNTYFNEDNNYESKDKQDQRSSITPDDRIPEEPKENLFSFMYNDYFKIEC